MSTANAVVSETSPKVRLAVVFGLLLLVAVISVGVPVAGVVTPVIVGILAFVTWHRTGSKLLIGIMAICTCLAGSDDHPLSGQGCLCRDDRGRGN